MKRFVILLLLLLVVPAGAQTFVPGRWGVTDTSKPRSIVWPADWPGVRNLRAQWWKILADSPLSWVFSKHAKGEPPDNTYYLWRFDKPMPEGTKLLIEGDFPHARMFDLQVCAPWQASLPFIGDGTGIPEVPLLDEDIVPDPGHTNPFRPGENRNARYRHYHVTFELRDGDPVVLNGNAMLPPYRSPGNLRVGCTRLGKDGPRGPVVWVRIFLPDGYDPYGGVEPPVLRIQYPGQAPVLAPITREVEYNINQTQGAPYTIAENPAIGDRSLKEAESFQWLADWASMQVANAGTVGDFRPGQTEFYTLPNQELKLIKLYDTAYFIGWQRNIGDPNWCSAVLPQAYRSLYGKGQFLPPPANEEHTSGQNLYNSYLTGVASLKPNTFLVFTGKGPQTPRTLSGTRRASASPELRYWNITLHVGSPRLVPVVNITDELVMLDVDRRYMIVIGNVAERPANATVENGISWFALPTGNAVAISIRSMSTSPIMWANAPNAVTWTETDYCDPAKYETAVKARMGEYYWQPRYMTKAEIEAMGQVGRAPYVLPSVP